MDREKEKSDSTIQERLAELESIRKDLVLIQATVSHALEKVASAEEGVASTNKSRCSWQAEEGQTRMAASDQESIWKSGIVQALVLLRFLWVFRIDAKKLYPKNPRKAYPY